ncbi:MAG: cytochrome c-type biogenesis protein CcmH [Pseudomonadaceae bacterium]|nr:cytochrome c-type biogenesis protein CcmH [Pseudomonadaceae bacterium]
MLRVICLMLFLAALHASAASPVDVYSFDSPEQQQRYKGLIAEFRCPKCLNTNIAGSDAPIAQDLRRTVHRLVVQEGYSDQEVRDFLQARYGDFVLYNPPLNSRTLLIWLVPLGLAIVGVLVLFGLLRRARQQQVVDLDDSQRQRVRALLDE